MEPDTSSKLIKLEKEDVNKGTYFASMQKCIGKHIGVIGGLVCGTVNASMEVAGKSMIGYYPPAELLFLRYAIHLPLNMAIILATKNSFKPCMSDINTVLVPLFIGCSSVTMHTVWNKCLKLSEVSKVMLAVQCDIPIGFILQWIFFNEIPTTLAILGGCCVVVGVMLTTLEDIIMRRLCGK
ncbi:Uncharacterised protein g3907 [Pycnogonum litorale]